MVMMMNFDFLENNKEAMKLFNSLKKDFVKKSLMKESYLDYILTVNPGYVGGRHIELMAKTLQDFSDGILTRVIFEAPPRHMKSDLGAKGFASWHLGKNPDDEVVLVASDASLAEDFSRSNMKKVREYGNEFFGLKISKKKATAKEWHIEGHKGSVRAIGWEGSIVGRGAHKLIIDDMIKTRAQADSETYRERMWKAFEDDIESRLSPEPGSGILICMTRWDPDDLVGRVLQRDGRVEDGGLWTVISLPALCTEDNVQTDPLGRQVGDILWPERFSKEYILDVQRASMKGTGRKWISMYQQKPQDLQDIKIDMSKVVYFEDLTFPENEYDWVLSADLTFGHTKNSDKVAIGVWAVHEIEGYNLIDGVNEQMGYVVSKETILKFLMDYPRIRMVLIESKANGQAIEDDLKESIPFIHLYNPGRNSKTERLELSLPYIKTLLRLKVGCKIAGDLIMQISRWGKMKHKDCVDMTTQLINFYEIEDGVDEVELIQLDGRF
jgi:hypothetical protein